MADALSRRETPATSQLLLLTTPTFEFLKILLPKNQSDVDLLQLRTEVLSNSEKHPHFSINNEILYFKGNTF